MFFGCLNDKPFQGFDVLSVRSTRRVDAFALLCIAIRVDVIPARLVVRARVVACETSTNLAELKLSALLTALPHNWDSSVVESRFSCIVPFIWEPVCVRWSRYFLRSPSLTLHCMISLNVREVLLLRVSAGFPLPLFSVQPCCFLGHCFCELLRPTLSSLLEID